jgi:regulator of sirC expression with transglutaminase-like and TPR domain
VVDLTFRDEIQITPINLPRAALRFSKEIAYPTLEIDRYLALLDQLGGWARAVVPLDSPAFLQARELGEFLFQRFGFHGNAEAYEDPRNSYLNEVMDRRLGIPISLSVLFVAVAQAVGLQAYGIGLPGHFIVGVQDQLGVAYFDPFHAGRQLTVEDCARLVESTAGVGGTFQMEWLQPAAPADILVRMLNNLRNVYLKGEAWPQLIAVIERLRLLQPDLPGHLRDLGLLHHQLGALRLAIQFYEQYLQRAPDAPDAETVRGNLQAAASQIARKN